MSLFHYYFKIYALVYQKQFLIISFNRKILQTMKKKRGKKERRDKCTTCNLVNESQTKYLLWEY